MPPQRRKHRYSITSSARASSVGGIVNSRALAVARLMTRGGAAHKSKSMAANNNTISFPEPK